MFLEMQPSPSTQYFISLFILHKSHFKFKITKVKTLSFFVNL